MPHKLLWEGDGVYVRFRGTVTAAEIVSTYQQVSRDARSDQIRYVLTDYREASRCPEMTRADVQGFAALERGASYSNETVWRAAVANDATVNEFLDYFAGLRLSPDPFRSFTTLEEARAWIATHPMLLNTSPSDPSSEPGQPPKR